MRGSVDHIHNGKCFGWAFDEPESAPVLVSIFIDGRLAVTGKADRYRADLLHAGVGDGNAAFVIDIPGPFRDGLYHAIEARSQAGELIAEVGRVQLLPSLTPEEFTRTAPWLDDGNDARFHAGVHERVAQGRVSAADAERLEDFREDGFVVLEQAIPHRLIDILLADVERAWNSPPPVLVLNNELGEPTLMGKVLQRPGFRSTSFRYLDFHNVSDACAEIMTNPRVVAFIRAYLDADVAAMQNLLFENGTQQRSHQDFVYVHSLKPASLAGAWVALEDVSPDAGPLVYWPKSHRLVPLYEFEDGTVLADGDGEHVRRYEEYLERACHELGLQKVEFCPKKGDVLVWHSALVHGGSPRRNLAQSRRSMVSHYTPLDAYPFDRRHPQAQPIPIWRNGTMYYASQREEHEEGQFLAD